MFKKWRYVTDAVSYNTVYAVSGFDGGMIVVITMPVTRNSVCVGFSVVMNSSAPPNLAAAMCKASRPESPAWQASV